VEVRLVVGAWTGIVMLLAGVITATPTRTTDITIWRR
jgi:hypothetical protein